MAINSLQRLGDNATGIVQSPGQWSPPRLLFWVVGFEWAEVKGLTTSWSLRCAWPSSGDFKEMKLLLLTLRQRLNTARKLRLGKASDGRGTWHIQKMQGVAKMYKEVCWAEEQSSRQKGWKWRAAKQKKCSRDENGVVNHVRSQNFI